MKNTHVQLIAVSILLLIAGCKKSSNGGNFTVNNQNGTTRMNIDIYTSLSDYANSTNVYVHGTAQAGGTFAFPLSKLKAGNWYYVDAYSDDYTVTNWVNDDQTLIGQDSVTPLRFKYSTGANDNYFMILSQQTNSRNVLLNGNQHSTTWIAVDALDLLSGTSIWNSMTTDEQNAKLVVNKDHSGTIYYDSTGAAFYNNFTFYSGITSYPVFNLIVDQLYLNMYISNTTTAPSTSLYVPTCMDTVQSLFGGYLYVLKKQ